MKVFNIALLGFFLAAFLNGILFLFLEKVPTVYIQTSSPFKYYYINLTRLFFTQKKHSINPKNILTLKNIILKGIYKNDKGGFIIIQDKGKTKFINLNETYNGYKLTFIGRDFAIFTRNNKKFKVSFKKEKNIPLSQIESKGVSKEVFLEYKNNLSKIWKNIGIIKTDEGYKITYIKKGSIFEKIGLKKGDILLEVNGKILKDDADAWQLYKEADKYDSFDIKLKRNNKIKEVYYEVY